MTLKGVSRDCPKFLSTPYYLRNGKSYGLQIWPVYIHRVHPNKSPFKILAKGERGHIQDCPKFLSNPYYLRKG